MYKVVTYTRTSLFEKVWSTPLLQLAKEIGVSDVALGKACRRAGIPLPGRGYWAKDAKARQKPALPNSSDARHDTIRFNVIAVDVPSAPRREVQPKLVPAVPTKACRAITVPTVLRNPHSLVARTLALAAKPPRHHERVRPGHWGGLNIRVSPAALDRALRVFDVLIKESERDGCTWDIVKASKGYDTLVTCDGQSMKVELTERIADKVIPPPKPGEPGWEPYYMLPKHEYTATGELTFHIDKYLRTPSRRTWTDGKRLSLEAKLGEILMGFGAVAAVLRQEELEREAERREAARREMLALERTRQQEALALVRARLVTSMVSWERASRIRHYCNALEAQAERLAPTDMIAAVEWIAWARSQADLLDPLKRIPPTIFALSITVPPYFNGKHQGETPVRDWWTGIDHLLE